MIITFHSYEEFPVPSSVAYVKIMEVQKHETLEIDHRSARIIIGCDGDGTDSECYG